MVHEMVLVRQVAPRIPGVLGAGEGQWSAFRESGNRAPACLWR